MMKRAIVTLSSLIMVFMTVSWGFSAYHHEGERDAARFLEVYPDKAGTKLDHCALCHSGGQYESRGRIVSLGSCQWCHYAYGYDGSGNILETMNPYGAQYHDHGRNAAAVRAVDDLDADGDGFSNKEEIEANRFPGDPADDPTLADAPYRIYTKPQLEALSTHTQFMLLNTSRSGDFYAEYMGVPMESLLSDAGMLNSATGIMVYAPDGWSQYHPLDPDEDPELYHAKGVYPESVFYYDPQADQNLNPVDGWCDYSAPSCQGRNHLDPIPVDGGLKMILATKREGVDLDVGVLNEDNKLDGEGPFRVVPPQKNPGPPDQSSTADNQDVIWPYNYDWDHNAGSATRTTTIIKVEPLPTGTTDIDLLEAGWGYVDLAKIIVYGAIDGTDSNGNGVLDSEEKINATSDFDNDGIPDFRDADTARFRHAQGLETIFLHTSSGSLANVKALGVADTAVPQSGKPDLSFPYGAFKFDVVGLSAGESVLIRVIFPSDLSSNARLFFISSSDGWRELLVGSNDGDPRMTLTLTDGQAATDADRAANGAISVFMALANAN